MCRIRPVIANPVIFYVHTSLGNGYFTSTLKTSDSGTESSTYKYSDSYRIAQFFDGENIDGQHLRPPVLAILLETIERENLPV